MVSVLAQERLGQKTELQAEELQVIQSFSLRLRGFWK